MILSEETLSWRTNIMAEFSKKNVVKALKNPKTLLKYIRSLGRGLAYKGWCKVTRKKVTIGKNFHLDGRISIKGPGTVIFGDNVRVGEYTTPWTFTEEAVIEIGNTVFLNGTRFACKKYIRVEDMAMIADSRIMDTDFHAEQPDKRRTHDDEPKPIIIGKNAWITIQTVVLKGSVVGENTILSPNSVIAGGNALPNKIYMGNPARAVKSL